MLPPRFCSRPVFRVLTAALVTSLLSGAPLAHGQEEDAKSPDAKEEKAKPADTTAQGQGKADDKAAAPADAATPAADDKAKADDDAEEKPKAATAAPKKVRDLKAKPYETTTFWTRVKHFCTALRPIPAEALAEPTPKPEDELHWREILKYCKDGSAPALSKLEDGPANAILLRLEALARLRSSREWIRPLREARDQLCDGVDRDKLLEQLRAGLPEARFTSTKQHLGPHLDALVQECSQSSDMNLGFKVLKLYRTFVNELRKESDALKSEPQPDSKDTAAQRARQLAESTLASALAAMDQMSAARRLARVAAETPAEQIGGMDATRTAGGSAGSLTDRMLSGLASFVANRARAGLEAILLNNLRSLLCANKTPAERKRATFFHETCAYMRRSVANTNIRASALVSMRAPLARDIADFPNHLRQLLTKGGQKDLEQRVLMDSVLLLLQTQDPASIAEDLVEIGHKAGFICDGNEGTATARCTKYEAKQLAKAKPCLNETCRKEQLEAAKKMCVVAAAKETKRCKRSKRILRVAGTLLSELRRVVRGADVPWRSVADSVMQEIFDGLKTAFGRKLKLDTKAIKRLRGMAATLYDALRATYAARQRLRRAKTTEERVAALKPLAVGARDAINALLRLSATSRQLAGESKSKKNDTSLIQLPRGLVEIFESVAKGDLPHMFDAVSDLVRRTAGDLFPVKALRMARLAAELAAAKTADEVQSIIEASAAPMDAWKMKRDGPLWSIGSIVGLRLSAELLPDAGGVGCCSPALSPSLMASLGIDYSRPLGNKSTVGVFFQLLDFGTLVSGRLFGQSPPNISVSGGAQVGVAQVISPGVFLRFGLGDTPFVLGLGAQLVRDARQITITTPSNMPNIAPTVRQDVASAILFGVFFGMDITLWPF